MSYILHERSCSRYSRLPLVHAHWNIDWLTFCNCPKMPQKILIPQATAHHQPLLFFPIFLPTDSPVSSHHHSSLHHYCFSFFFFFVTKTHHIFTYKWAPLPSLNSLFPSSPPSPLRFPCSCSTAPFACPVSSKHLLLSKPFTFFVFLISSSCFSYPVILNLCAPRKKLCGIFPLRTKVSWGDSAGIFTCHQVEITYSYYCFFSIHIFYVHI